MIKPFPFELPADCHGEVVGFLYEADDPADLGQDMIEVQLSSGVTIDAGWYPEGAADGAYVVKAWHPRGIECSVESYASVADAAAAITRWISGDPQALPACSTPARPEL
jgi:hypothetical protein